MSDFLYLYSKRHEGRKNHRWYWVCRARFHPRGYIILRCFSGDQYDLFNHIYTHAHTDMPIHTYSSGTDEIHCLTTSTITCQHRTAQDGDRGYSKVSNIIFYWTHRVCSVSTRWVHILVYARHCGKANVMGVRTISRPKVLLPSANGWGKNGRPDISRR